MRAVIQRVTQGTVTVEQETVGSIGPGLLVLLGVAADDAPQDADWMAVKICHLRIFEDDAGKLNRSLIDCRREMLVVSQFTLYGDCRKGRRPSFVKAAAPEKGESLYRRFVDQVRQEGVTVATGRFRSRMDVALVNQGPVTLIVDSR
ncbi:MAG: D-tyrosyl-tRNA(Tyr) deacylase [Desulfobacteraceae bacterium]|nr:D-tyrosyl-tRNA(Tyr) deacylase [Desulfobacteraceae bacterium]MBC2753716.1 D-tyrosyl-tRNA(Tyr) deacylase [Desulfobacteraceae bacterium]